MALVTDDYGRPVRSMRIQVNTTCNFGCFFCHMEGTGVNSGSMTADEIERIVQTASKWGVNKIKFTGGEPTLRRDMVDIVRRTRKYITGDISMTTNGVMLPRLAKELKEAGLDRINISLHSIEREKFQFITGVDAISQVIEGIKAAHDAGFYPIKVNFVVLKDLNVDQIPLMIALSAEHDVILQLIEFETTRENEKSEDFLKYHIPLDGIEKSVASGAFKVEYNELHRRPKYYTTRNGRTAIVEFVKPMRNSEFCNNCTRIRLTSTGSLKPCLMRNDNLTDIVTAVRKDDEQKNLDDIFLKAARAREPYWKKEDELENHGEIFWVSEG